MLVASKNVPHSRGTLGAGRGLIITLLAPLCLLIGRPTEAGGPLVVHQGEAGYWAEAIPLAIDAGTLGPLSNDQASLLIAEAAGRWAAIPHSRVSFSEFTELLVDLDETNILPFFGGHPIGSGELRPENPIIFDDDGEVVDLLLGTGSKNAVLGFAGPRFINTTTRQYLSAFAVFNGRFANSPSFISTVVHEFGHLIGLDHTQALHQLADNGFGGDNLRVPVMYPFAIAGATSQPLYDDEQWASWVSPRPEFHSERGAISGVISRRDGRALQGANVVAVRVNDNLSESDEQVVSVVSGFLVSNGGGYILPGLEPGPYVVFVEPLRSQFVGGSSVGPFDSRFDAFPKDYFNSSGETGTASDNPQLRSVIRVRAGEVVSDIDLIANEPDLAPTVDAGTDQIVLSGQIVQLIATASDPDGDSLNFSWKQISGPGVDLTSSTESSTSFTAPGVVQPAVLVFEVSVTAGQTTVSDRTNVTVLPVPGNRTPVVDAGFNQVVTKGELVVLDGAASDPDGDALEITWTQISGPPVELAGARTLRATFVAPILQLTRQLFFRLRVFDGRGGLAEDTVRVTVTRNRPPVVSVQPLISALPGEPVTIEAFASDPDGDELTFSWEQTRGAALDAQEVTGPAISFTAPQVTLTTAFAFRVTVDDGGESAETETVVVVTSVAPVVLPMTLRRSGALFDRTFVGGAIVNAGPVPTSMYIGGRGFDGVESPRLSPVGSLPSRGQVAFLTDQIIDAGNAATLIVQGSDAPLAGFFLMGGEQRLDGVGHLSLRAKNLSFRTVISNEERRTLLYLFNSNQVLGTQATLRLFGPDGVLSAETSVAIRPGGTLLSSVRTVFGLEADLEADLGDGYLTVESERRLQGMALVASSDVFTAISAQSPKDVTSLRAPHFFTGGDGVRSVLRLVNLGPAPAHARVTAFGDAGEEMASHDLSLQPGEAFSGALAQLLPETVSDSMTTGHLEVRVNSGQAGPFLIPARVIGGLTFSTNHGKAESSLPLVDQPLSTIIFPHVAQSDSLALFHGLAILNVGPRTADVEVRAFDATGKESAFVEIHVPEGGRIVDVLNGPTFFGPEFEQSDGHLQLLSSEPVYAFSLFGDSGQNFLAAVEGQDRRPLR